MQDTVHTETNKNIVLIYVFIFKNMFSYCRAGIGQVEMLITKAEPRQE